VLDEVSIPTLPRAVNLSLESFSSMTAMSTPHAMTHSAVSPEAHEVHHPSDDANRSSMRIILERSFMLTGASSERP
jgi:hypothetical protein